MRIQWWQLTDPLQADLPDDAYSMRYGIAKWSEGVKGTGWKDGETNKDSWNPFASSSRTRKEAHVVARWSGANDVRRPPGFPSVCASVASLPLHGDPTRRACVAGRARQASRRQLFRLWPAFLFPLFDLLLPGLSWTPFLLQFALYPDSAF
jgi:hypothetical protein